MKHEKRKEIDAEKVFWLLIFVSLFLLTILMLVARNRLAILTVIFLATSFVLFKYGGKENAK